MLCKFIVAHPEEFKLETELLTGRQLIAPAVYFNAALGRL